MGMESVVFMNCLDEIYWSSSSQVLNHSRSSQPSFMLSRLSYLSLRRFSSCLCLWPNHSTVTRSVFILDFICTIIVFWTSFYLFIFNCSLHYCNFVMCFCYFYYFFFFFILACIFSFVLAFVNLVLFIWVSCKGKFFNKKMLSFHFSFNPCIILVSLRY